MFYSSFSSHDWVVIERRILEQPGFNRWTYFHKARKIERRMRSLNRNDPDGIEWELLKSFSDMRAHYIDLCWHKDCKSRYAEDSQHDLQVYRNNARYKKWARKHKFYVGKIIKITEKHSATAREYGVNEEVRVIEIYSRVGNGCGFPHIRVERVRDGYRETRPIGFHDEREVAVYDAAWFVIPKEGLRWNWTMSEKRDHEEEL